MSHRNHESDNQHWQPTASVDVVKARAQLMTAIRVFFAERDVLEVETPILSQHATTDPFIDSIQTSHGVLQTSPEFAMKRLLSAQFPSIYQVAKVFRQEESGRWHNPEFSMLEWYRLDFDHHALMDEMDAFLQYVLGCRAATRFSYQQVFLLQTGLDPLRRDDAAIREYIRKTELLGSDLAQLDYDDCLQLLFSHIIEPKLGHQAPVMIYGYPASQSSLARINPDDDRIADRFEVYFKGCELANGFFELNDATEQRARFEADNQQRKAFGKPQMPIDEHLLDALSSGFPNCAGVALGIDRLLMLKLGCQHIDEVLTFPTARA